MQDYQLSPLMTKLLDRQILELGGSVDEQMFDYVRTALVHCLASGGPDLTVKITSSGGDVTYGLLIHDELANYPGKLIGVVSGFANSMASIILQACDERIIFPHATVCIHNMWRKITLDKMRSPKLRLEQLQEMEKLQGMMNRIYADRTGRTIPEIKRQCKLDRKMTAKEALAFGLVDQIQQVKWD